MKRSAIKRKDTFSSVQTSSILLLTPFVGKSSIEGLAAIRQVLSGKISFSERYIAFYSLCKGCSSENKKVPKKLDDGWPESEKGKDVDVKYIEERRRCEKISEERMNI